MRSAFRKWGNAYATAVASAQIACSGFGTQFECVEASSIVASLSSAEAASQAAVLLSSFEALAGCQPVDASSPYSSAALSRTLGALVTQVSAQVQATVCVGPGSTASAAGYVDCFSKSLGRSVANLVASAMIARGCLRGPRRNDLQFAVQSSYQQPICACTGWVQTSVDGTNAAAQVTVSGSCDVGVDAGPPSSNCGFALVDSSQTQLQALALQVIAQSALNACGYSDSAEALYNSTVVYLEAWGSALAEAAISAQSTCSQPSSGPKSMQCVSASSAIQAVIATQASVLAIGLASAMNNCPACSAMNSVDTQYVAQSIIDTVTAANVAMGATVCVGSGSTASVDGYVGCYARTCAHGVALVILDTMIQGGCFAPEQNATLVATADVLAVTQIDIIDQYCACWGWQAATVNGTAFFLQSNVSASCTA